MTLLRAFVAIHLTPEMVAALQQAQTELRATPGGLAGRWVPPENMHLTLKFLGDVDSERLPEIYTVVDAAAQTCAPLVLTLTGLGCFPNTRRPRVVWAGIAEPSGQLLQLAQALDLALGQLGLPREQRPYRAHLTLARVRQSAPRWQVEALGQAVEAHCPQQASMLATAVAVVRSDLRPQGPFYRTLHAAPLGNSMGG